MEKLSQEEIDSQLAKLRNYERLYVPQLKEKYQKLKRRVKDLEAELARKRRERQDTVEALKLQIEELCEMVYGRKRGKKDNDDQDGSATAQDELPPPRRSRAHLVLTVVRFPQMQR